MSEIRVDNITDEAGTGAPEIVDHYKKSNILGTVSESGGVPTGAIIERGSNSNGEFVRYADGTQICWRTVGIDTDSTANQEFNYPANFISNQIAVSLNGRDRPNNDVIRAISTAGVLRRPSEWRVIISDPTTGRGVRSNNVLLASGNWY